MSTVDGFLESISPQQLFDDPYPIYQKLRKDAPVAFIPQLGIYWITRYDDVAEVVAAKDPWGTSYANPEHPLRRTLGDPVITMVGGELHDDLRVGVDKTLRPRQITEVIEQSIRPLVKARARELAARGEADLVTEYFEPMSVEALRNVLGLDPYVDADTLVRWFKTLAMGAGNFVNDPAVNAQTEAVAQELEGIVLPVLDDLSTRPEDETMLSHMLWAGREDGVPRDVDRILSTVKIILLGGMQEPGHAASSSAYGLFTSGQWGLLREDSVEVDLECGARGTPLDCADRHRGPRARARPRVPRSNDPGRPPRRGDVGVGESRRDEVRRLRVVRHGAQREAASAFGGGPHFCAGHLFGRQVEKIMFEELLDATKDLTLKPGADVPVTGWVFRVPRSLQVEMQAA